MKSAIGGKVRGARRGAGFSQEALAEAIERTSATISNIERGKYTPSLPTLERIARVLGKPLADFVEIAEFDGASPSRIEQELRARALLRGLDDRALSQALAHLEAIHSYGSDGRENAGSRVALASRTKRKSKSD